MTETLIIALQDPPPVDVFAIRENNGEQIKIYQDRDWLKMKLI